MMTPPTIAEAHLSRSWLLGIVLSAAAAGPGAPATAQSGHVLKGHVRDTAGRAIAGANVALLPSGSLTLTSEHGHFALSALPSEPAVLLIRAVGFRLVREAIGLEADTLEIEVVMEPVTTTLPELIVEVNGKTYAGRAAEIAQRALRGTATPSSYIDRAELASWAPHDLADVLRRAGLLGRGRQVSCPRSSKIGQALPNISVYLDDQPFEEALSFPADIVPVSWLEAVEVYRGNAVRPVQYSRTGSLCTVLLWTRQ